ncbi:WAT1-related protein At4g08290-like [Rhododendron vialii]|uniref:WAT1-related protein At4g08290-like n=1 Tax=Rhododendron vialii TaxID=182163 RepID=UPI00265D6A27|nr:WAT1-related protein At4g08290-like [Rhododendron vialii]XP_058190083.1 WAT1-related protein At4g08290-like [Rhododendron vialii]
MGDQTCCGMLHLGLKKAMPYLLMVGLQCGSAGMYIISDATLKQGMSRYVLIVYRNAIAAISLAPFAFFFERQIRPKMTVSIFLKIMVLAILEPILDQNLTYLGMNLTSASFASAIMNAVPAVTFVLAVILRLEQVKIKEVRSQAKVMGTLLTFAGALIMTIYKGPIINFIWSQKASHLVQSNDPSDKHWLTGTLCILVGCFAWASFFILQSITVKKYPAELSLAFWICLMGAVQSAALTLVAEHHPGIWAIGWNSRLLAPVYTGIISSGITYYVQGLVMKTRGPVFVTAFNPLCMIIVSVLGSIILAEKIHLGSIIGAIIIAIGLYAVVWGKGKDRLSPVQPLTDGKKVGAGELPISTADITKPAEEGAKIDKLVEASDGPMKILKLHK